MKKINITFIFLGILSLSILSVLAIGSYDSHGLTLSSTGTASQGDYAGVRIQAKSNISIRNITLVSGVSGNVVTIFNETGGIGGSVNTIVNQSAISNSLAQINASLLAGQYYHIAVNGTNGSSWNNRCYPASSPDIILVEGINIRWVNGSFNNVSTNFDTFCNILKIDYDGTYFSMNGSNYNSSTAETSTEAFSTNFSSSSAISSANLIYNFTSYSATVTSLGGNDYRLTSSLDIPFYPLISVPFYWNLTFANGTNTNSDFLNQLIYPINLSLCQSAPQNINFFNITFANETSGQERVNASIPSSTWYYWLGTGILNRSFTYSTGQQNAEYSWCFSPTDKRVNVQVDLTYDNAESEQRTYSPSTLSLSNTTTGKTLFLLPSSLGQYVTFQVINTAQQPLSNVDITATRSGIGVVEESITDSSGSVTFFLNPNFAYDFVFSKSGFDDFETTITPSQTSYTITMGGSSSSTNSTNSASGMSFVILPSQRTLNNGTTYNFNLTLNSSYWSLSSWGFTLQNRSGYVFDSESSTSSNGGFLSSNLNTGLNNTIVMNYFWVINGVYNNATVVWGVVDLSGNSLSIFQFLTDLRNYVSLGFFGLDDIGLGLITFLAIFLVTGVMSYKYGINSPAAIMAFIFSLTAFFDIGLGLVPNPIGAIPHAPTFFIFIIFVATFFREIGR